MESYSNQFLKAKDHNVQKYTKGLYPLIYHSLAVAYS